MQITSCNYLQNIALDAKLTKDVVDSKKVSKAFLKTCSYNKFLTNQRINLIGKD